MWSLEVKAEWVMSKTRDFHDLYYTWLIICVIEIKFTLERSARALRIAIDRSRLTDKPDVIIITRVMFGYMFYSCVLQRFSHSLRAFVRSCTTDVSYCPASKPTSCKPIGPETKPIGLYNTYFRHFHPNGFSFIMIC